MKFSGLKEILAFPPLRFLKFDLTGIPIVLSLLLLGLSSGATTSLVAFFAILARSGEFVGSSMKALAEFSTILGMQLGLRWPEKFRRPISVAFGVLFRVLIMTLANFVVQPLYYGYPFVLVVALSPLVGVFNVLHGCLSMLGGYILYEALIRRIPSLAIMRSEA